MSILQNAMAHATSDVLIISNGSKWTGESLDSLEKLLDVLRNNTLDPVFEQHGIYQQKGWIPSSGKTESNTEWFGHPYYSGDFYKLSHAFSVVVKRGSEAAKQLERAFSDNINSDAYQRLAFKRYSGHLKLEHTSGRHILVTPLTWDAIQNGLHRTLSKSEWRLVGERFTSEQKLKYSSSMSDVEFIHKMTKAS